MSEDSDFREVEQLIKSFIEESRAAQHLRGIGYAHVTLDLMGYRRGSLNEPIQLTAPPAPPVPTIG